VRIHGNTIRALAGARPPGAIRVPAGAGVLAYDNAGAEG
jgi:hypothetical protein